MDPRKTQKVIVIQPAMAKAAAGKAHVRSVQTASSFNVITPPISRKKAGNSASARASLLDPEIEIAVEKELGATTSKKKTQAAEWTEESTLMLIHLYEQHPHLYDVTHKDYKNKGVRIETLQTIAAIMSQSRPNTSAQDVKEKMNSLRTQFREAYAEYKKTHSGDAFDDHYIPSMKYFLDMFWLRSHLNIRKAISNFTDDGEDGSEPVGNNEASAGGDEDVFEELIRDEELRDTPMMSANNPPPPGKNVYNPPPTGKINNKAKQKTTMESFLDSASKCFDTLAKPARNSPKKSANATNYYDAFAALILAKLNSLPPDSANALHQALMQVMLNHGSQ